MTSGLAIPSTPETVSPCGPEGPAPAASGVTTGALARLVGATLEGPEGLVVLGVEAIDQAGPGCLTLIRSAKFARQWAGSRATAALVSGGIDVPGHDASSRALLRVPDADLALVTAHSTLFPPPPRPPAGVHPAALVDPAATVDATASVGALAVVGPGCRVGPGAVVGAGCVLSRDVVVGAGTVLHPRVTLLDATVVGERCIVHAGAVLGADGFGYRPAPDGRGLLKLPHAGNVVIGDDVEIGANATIDRARFGSTTVGAGTKIDNLVQIAHNCRIGRGCVLCGCVGLAGSVTLGDGVMLGGNVGVADNITIGAGAQVAAKSGVMDDIPAGGRWAGLPAMDGREYMRMLTALRRLNSRRAEKP